MKVIFSENTRLHNPGKEFISHSLIDYAESPQRVSEILNSLKIIDLIDILPPEEFSFDDILKVHSADYISYLETAYENWTAAGLNKDGVMPDLFAVGSMHRRLITKSPIGQAGYYMTDLSTMIVEGTFKAAKYSAYSALTAAKHLMNGERSIFSLGRPPGHHAGYNFAGGYCFINNAACAAKFIQDNSRSDARICILDVDYHHGNGTQDIVQRQENMLYVSIHGHPDSAYPYLTGFEEENSEKVINYPIKGNAGNVEYLSILKDAAGKISSFGPDYFIVSFGVDTHESENEDLGTFRLTTDFYGIMAEFLRKSIAVPTLIIMEGGYQVSILGANVRSFLGPYL